LASTGLAVSTSMTMPGPRLLMAEMASAPASTTAWATSTMSSTFGESLTMSGMSVFCLMRRVTWAET
jgi:hypothetical protein